MKHRNFSKIILLSFFLLILISAGTALAETNIVPATNLDDYSKPITPNDLKPPECPDLTPPAVYVIVTSPSPLVGPNNQNSLILGGTGGDTITGSSQGNNHYTHCIMGGAGEDEIKGGKQNETILGGPGNDTIYGGKGDDTIYGGDGYDSCVDNEGTNIFYECEIINGITQ